MTRLWPVAAVAALGGAVWFFILRIGRRRPPGDDEPIGVDGALAYARWATAPPGPQHGDLARLWAPSSASHVEVMPEGRTFYPRMLGDISGATQSIHIMQYGFNPGIIGDQFAPVLMEKARAGVAVRIIVDSLGSHAYLSSRPFYATLAEAGIEVMLHDFVPPDRHGPVGRRRWLARLWQTGRVEHRKLVLVDGTTAYMGGAGIEDHFFDGRFHDVYIRFTGPVTQQLQAIFLASFAYHGGNVEPDAVDASFRPVEAEGEHPVTPVMNWPRGWLPLTEAAGGLIRSAAERLDIMNYYIGDDALIAEILAAAERGVRVRLVIADEAHANVVTYGAFKHRYDELLAAGVEIWEYPAVVHAKVIVADDRTLIGTLNLDAWALYRNPEIGLLFESAAVAEQFRAVLFEPDIAASKPGVPAVGGLTRARNRIYARANYVL
jgi:cardiolipin synthase